MPLQSVTSGQSQPADKADCHVGNTVEIDGDRRIASHSADRHAHQAALRSDAFTIANLPERLGRQKQDPWQDYERLRQHITTAMLEMFT